MSSASRSSTWLRTRFHFAPEGRLDWALTHAAVPTAHHLGGDIWRIYWASRDALSRSRIGFTDLELGPEPRLVGVCREPVLDLGRPGHFDGDGVYAMSIHSVGEELRLYYGGWNAGARGLFYAGIGLAVSRDGGLSFQRHSLAPILGRDEVDPWACLAPCVMRRQSDWIMWYVSGLEIGHRPDGAIYSRYETRTALSEDGLSWQKTGRTAIAIGDADTNIGRVSVLHDSQYRAWYPFVRAGSTDYRLGYAESQNGLEFVRLDDAEEAALHPTGTPGDWDSDAIAYPHVIVHNERRYMLYNGNMNGRTGFGVAVWG